MQLKSYVQGRWHAGERDAQVLRDATTGQVVAEASSSGIDFAGVLQHARRKGGPALRQLTFHERAALLKRVAKLLTDHKDEFYALSYATGATKADSWIDIDGGIGTLFAYASRGARELPNSRVYVDGDVEASVEDRNVHRPAHLRAAGRRGDPHQRVQLPGVGHAGKAVADAAGGHAGDREACDGDCLSHRAGRPAHRRVRHPAGRRAAARLRQPRRCVRASHLPGRRVVHGLGEHGAEAAHASGHRRELGAVHQRDRFDQLLRARARRRARPAGVRCVRARSRARDDGEGGPEVHRDPQGDRAGGARRSGRAGDQGGSRQDRRRRSAARAGAHGSARRARSAARSARAHRGAQARSRIAHRRGRDAGAGGRGSREGRVRRAGAAVLSSARARPRRSTRSKRSGRCAPSCRMRR